MAAAAAGTAAAASTVARLLEGRRGERRRGTGILLDPSTSAPGHVIVVDAVRGRLQSVSSALSRRPPLITASFPPFRHHPPPSPCP